MCSVIMVSIQREGNTDLAWQRYPGRLRYHILVAVLIPR